MLEALEALLGDHADVHIGDGRADHAEDNDGENVVLDVVDLDGGHACHDHQIEGKAGDTIHLIVVDVLAVHQVALAQHLDDGADQHTGNGGPQEVEAPCDAVGKVGDNAQQVHKAEGDGVGQCHEAGLNGELVHRLVVGDLGTVGVGLIDDLAGGSCLTDMETAALLADVDVQHAEHGGHHETDGGEGQAEAAVACEHGGGGVGKVDVPAEGVAGALTEGQGEDETADIGDDLLAVAGQQEQEDGNAHAHEGLQHIGAALQCAELHHLCLVGLVGALFRLEGHGGKADGEAVIGDDLHEAVIHHDEAKLLGDNVHHQQQRTAQQCRGNEALAEQGDGAAQNIAQHQKQQQKAKLYHKRPNGVIICHCKIPTECFIHVIFSSLHSLSSQREMTSRWTLSM